MDYVKEEKLPSAGESFDGACRGPYFVQVTGSAIFASVCPACYRL
jgi:hypothetical protein